MITMNAMNTSNAITKNIEDETVDTLKALLRMDTRRLRHNEIDAIRYIGVKLDSLGVKNQIYEPCRNRGNIVGVIEGERQESIVLYSHVDTEEYLDEGKWIYTPSSGMEVKGRIFGRGALDCKGLIAVWLSIIKAIALRNEKPAKTLIFVCVCDEENQGDLGLKWLLDNTGYFNHTSLVISEGGGYPLKFKDKVLYTCQTGERSRIVVDKESVTDEHITDNPYFNLLKGYTDKYYNLRTLQYALHNKNTKENIRSIPWDNFTKNFIIKEDNAYFLYKLPFAEEEAKALNRSEISQYIRLLHEELKGYDRSFAIMPYVTPGFSDNRHFRERGINTLGFFPIHIDNGITGIHGINEYISRESIRTAYIILINIIERLIC